ncbi:MAG: hypothetical protein JJ979_14245 [Roseibium sp.]|nr:hypothetical protein [Roseibium sp.]
MTDSLKTLFRRFVSARTPDIETAAHDDDKTSIPFSDRIDVLNTDPYLMIADAELRLISVFDDLRYDRADLDILSGPMRRRALTRLTPLGFKQRSGSVIENRAEDIRIHMPKFRALGASPFDALRDTHLRTQDYALLTPTQAAAQIITRYPTDTALEKLSMLVVKHPVNLLRLFDFLEPGPSHQAFRDVLGQLVYLQRKAVSREPLKTRRALR